MKFTETLREGEEDELDTTSTDVLQPKKKPPVPYDPVEGVKNLIQMSRRITGLSDHETATLLADAARDPDGTRKKILNRIRGTIAARNS